MSIYCLNCCLYLIALIFLFFAPVTADISSRVILKDDLEHSVTWTQYFNAYGEFCTVQMTVIGIAVAYYFSAR
jgi:hypothetical protein